jgi:hypothetical protein
VQAVALLGPGASPSQNEVGTKRKKPKKKKKSGIECGNEGIRRKQTFFFREKKDILLGLKRDGMAEKGVAVVGRWIEG